MISYAKTDTGLVRRSNQDFLFAADQPVGPLPNLFIVADGMGGHKAGDFASRYVVEHMKEYIENSDLASPVMILRKALEKTNQSGLEAIEPIQTESALSLGMSRLQTMRYVVLPKYLVA